MPIHTRKHRTLLKRIARRAMVERGLLPDFSEEALSELGAIEAHPIRTERGARDLRHLLWASIDNDDSRDLDQLTVAEALPDGTVKILVAIANVDAVVRKGSAIDNHALRNTTSVYTAAEVFPMLPEALSTGLTSLNYHEDRLAVVIEMIFNNKGLLRSSDIYRAVVRNQAKLAYNSVAAWLDGEGPAPDPVVSAKGLDVNLRVQDRVAQQLKEFRHDHGALSLETTESRPVFIEDEIFDLEIDKKNRAKELIEDFMIAANGVTARYLEAKGAPSLRRVVHSPRRWDRIVEVASEFDFPLPPEPNSKALEQFLIKQRATDPTGFPVLSLTIIKLMGPGEYIAEFPGEVPEGHFGLAVKDYTHSTAPNRRYPDLVTQRLLKAALDGATSPYTREELTELARHCTEKEDDVNKVERMVQKSAAALLLEPKIGQQFEALVTGAAEKGTWVRLLHPPVEGKLVEGFSGADIGHRIRVQLIRTDVEKGFIDFKRVR